jgi:hypothetical protein
MFKPHVNSSWLARFSPLECRYPLDTSEWVGAEKRGLNRNTHFYLRQRIRTSFGAHPTALAMGAGVKRSEVKADHLRHCNGKIMN